MEKKTYKEAQKILERFDERPTLKKLTPSSPILPRSPIVTGKNLVSRKKIITNQLISF